MLTIFKELLAWIDRQAVTLDEIQRKQARYARAIKVEIAEMEKAYQQGNVPEQKRRMVRVQGYYKTAARLVREGK